MSTEQPAAAGTISADGLWEWDGTKWVPAGPAQLAAPWRKIRPPALVAGLIIATFGLYSFWWLYVTWSELKRELRRRQMNPLGHVIGILVPVYGWASFAGHLLTIQRLGQRRGLASKAGIATGTLSWAIALLMSWSPISVVIGDFGWTIFIGPNISLGLRGFLAGAVMSAVLSVAQASLNRAWQSLPGPTAAFQMHPVEWVVLVGGSTLTLVILLLGILVCPAGCVASPSR